MSDSIPKRIRIDSPSAGTITPTEKICSPTGQIQIDSTKEDTTAENAIKEELICLSNMPEPVLEEILKNLSLRDLKTVVLLSMKWRREGERSPDLWKGSIVRVHDRDEIKKLTIKRLKHLEEVEVHVHPGDQWEDADWDAFFEATLSLSRLKKIRGLEFRTLDSVQPEMLAKALSKLESVNLSGSEITKDQAEELFKKICQKKPDLTDAAKSVDEEGAPRQKTCLKVLNLRANDLSAVEPELMGKAVSGLEEVDLQDSSITAPQVQELFAQMNQGTQLQVLDLSYNNLSAVEPGLLGKVISGLEEVHLCTGRDPLTEPQVQELFSHMNQGTQMKKLYLNGNDLSAVEPGLLGKVVARLEEVNLYGSRLTAPQVQELFVQMTQGTKLKELDLRHNNLSSVDPEVLSRAVHRLEVVRLLDTNLTREQYDRIVSGGDGQSNLKELLLWDPNRYKNVNILDEVEDVDDDEDEDVSDYMDEDVDEDVDEGMKDYVDVDEDEDVKGEEIDMEG